MTHTHTHRIVLGGDEWHTHARMLMEERNGTHTYMKALGGEEWHTHTHTQECSRRRGMAHPHMDAFREEEWHTHTWMLLEERNGTHTHT